MKMNKTLRTIYINIEEEDVTETSTIGQKRETKKRLNY